jgi:hypothetical protein
MLGRWLVLRWQQLSDSDRAVWDGISWSVVASPITGGQPLWRDLHFDVAVWAAGVYGGGTLIERWDGIFLDRRPIAQSHARSSTISIA